MTDATITAEKLLQANAVRLSPKDPFTWASGWKSPIYCDNRQLLSQPFARDYIKTELSSAIFESYENAEVIAGVATAGIAWGAMVADQLKLPFIYVRSKPKEHGLGNQIEGQYSKGQKVIVMEDLISTAKSSLEAVSALQSQGLQVLAVVSIFNYGFEIAEQAFRDKGVAYLSLTSYPSLIQLAEQKGLVSPNDKEALLKWRYDPAGWSGIQ